MYSSESYQEAILIVNIKCLCKLIKFVDNDISVLIIDVEFCDDIEVFLLNRPLTNYFLFFFCL